MAFAVGCSARRHDRRPVRRHRPLTALTLAAYGVMLIGFLGFDLWVRRHRPGLHPARRNPRRSWEWHHDRGMLDGMAQAESGEREIQIPDRRRCLPGKDKSTASPFAAKCREGVQQHADARARITPWSSGWWLTTSSTPRRLDSERADAHSGQSSPPKFCCRPLP